MPPVVTPPVAVPDPGSAAAASVRDATVGAAVRAGAAVGTRVSDPRDRIGDADPAPASSSTDASTGSASTGSVDPSTAAAPATALPVATTAAPDAGSSALAALAPVQQAAPLTAPPAPAPVAPTLVATTDPSVAQQLQGPLLSLRSAPDGDHVMVVRVSPEHLGSVTVHATVSHGDLSVQLVASTAGGHDALRSMLTDLRRDLGAGGAGTATTLSLATGDAPQQDTRGQQQMTWVGTGAGGSSGGGSSARDDRLHWTATARPADDTGTTAPRLPASSSALLDVLA